MSVNRLVLPAVLAALAILPSCGSSNSGTTNPVPPPSGSFSNSNLNGTYVFSVSGIDSQGAPYAVVGTFAANGSGGITAGTIDVNDADISSGPVANSAITGSNSYKVNVDGRGEVTLGTSPLGTITLDFVLQDSSHGLLTEFDSSATGSGTLDLQTAATPSGAFAFNFSGSDFTSGTADPFATVGNFTISSGGAITGLEDLNDNGIAYADETLTGTIVAGPSTTPSSSLTPSSFPAGAMVFDVFVIDSKHLKFIEMDATRNLVGDAYAATSTTMPSGTLAFTLAGDFGSGGVSAAGGFMVTDGSGNITSASTIDSNNGGTVGGPVGFSGTYTATGAGRSTLTPASPFPYGNTYAAYPFSGGVFLLEIDDSGIMSGAAFPQSQTTLAGGQGYGLNFTGVNECYLADPSTCPVANPVEVDDIAEFTASSSGLTVTGVADENFQPGGGPTQGLALSGTYTTPDSNGRGQVGATAGNTSNSTLNGGFTITYYSVDGTTYPFIETDSGGGQVTAGAFFLQNPTAAAAAAAKSPHPFVVQPPVRARGRFRRPN
jgi:hypothetical protein